MKKIAMNASSKPRFVNTIKNVVMISQKISTPTTNDVKIVTDLANFNSKSSAYSEDMVRPVLNIIHELYIGKNQVPCWSQEEIVVRAVIARNPQIPLKVFGVKAGISNNPSNLVRVFVRNFLAALHNGQYSIPKPDCTPQSAPNGVENISSDPNQLTPPPNKDLWQWVNDNPFLAAGALVATGVFGVAVWKVVKQYGK